MCRLNNEIRPDCHVFAGKPRELGRQYGVECREKIKYNKALLNLQEWGNNVHKSLKDPKFLRWLHRREEIIGDNWPGIIEEIHGVAEGSGMEYIELLCLNLRAWWYNSGELLHKDDTTCTKNEKLKPEHTQCTSIVTALANGTIAAAGALDDSAGIYCGPVKLCPENGYRYIAFPISGTVWGGLGMNSEGLCVRNSSASFKYKAVETFEREAYEFDDLNIDIVHGVILRTCKTVEEARKVCERFPFSGNTICADAKGGTLIMQNTPEGSVELPFNSFQCITNHLIDDEDFYRFYDKLGIVERPLGSLEGSRIRRGYVMSYLRRMQNKLTQDEIVDFLGNRDDRIPDMTVNNRATIAVGYSEPQNHRNVIWFLQPQAKKMNNWFLRFEV